MLITRDYPNMYIVYDDIKRQFFYFTDVAYFIASGYFANHRIDDIINKIVATYSCSDISIVRQDCESFIKYLENITKYGVDEREKSSEERFEDNCATQHTAETDILDYACDNEIPFSATIEITDSCNLNCIHCYCAGSGASAWNNQNFKKLIDDLYSHGTMDLEITGGECLSHPCIFDFLSYAKQKGFIITLLTNATMITPMAADFIASLHPRNVQISVYSLKDEIHDRITTVKGSLQRTLQGIKALSSRGVTISIATPILDVNVNHVLGMNQWAMENGYDIRFSYKMSPSSNKNKMPETHSVILQNKNNTLPSIFRMTEFNTKLKNIMTKPARIHGDGRHLCQGGFRNLSIDYLGNVHPCNTIRYSFGNIIENDFESIWNSDAAKKWRAITIDDYPICANCKARKYCEPCPADYFAKTGSISHIDEQSCIYGKAIYDYIKENNL